MAAHEALRRFLHLLIALTLLGAGCELLLVGHTEDVWQWTPLVLIPLALAAQAWLVLSGSRIALRGWQGVMLLLIVSGFVGLGFHWNAKMEFKQESNPSLTGLRLFWESLHSESPPPLAPGMLVQTGLLGLTVAYRHPAASKASDSSKNDEGEVA